MTPIALTIAGSDSGGGAGIQADIKTFSALGTYGCSVITALTAQNTLGVQGIYDVEADFVIQQLDCVFSDLSIDAVKVGMLSNSHIINAVANAIEQYAPAFLVVDPVILATSGDALLQQNAIEDLKQKLIPQASLITPNLPEAALLLNTKQPETLDDMVNLIEPLMALGSKAVLLKGGHLSNQQAIDLFYDGQTLQQLESPWITTQNTHGTGCTLSSAVTALLAQGYALTEAVTAAKKYISEAIAHGRHLTIGQGHGPVHHFYRNG